MNELPCIACKKEMEPVFSGEHDEHTNQPYAGTVFTSDGHYGSTVFDPMNNTEFLEVTICDECLMEAAEAEQARVIHGHHTTRHEYTYTNWSYRK